MRRGAASEWISVPEAARLKGVAEPSVRVAMQAGRLMAAKVGRSYIVRRRDVETRRPGPRGPKRGRPGEAGKQPVPQPAAPDAMPAGRPQVLPSLQKMERKVPGARGKSWGGVIRSDGPARRWLPF